MPVGQTQITITLTDDNPMPLSSFYFVIVDVAEKPPIDPCEACPTTCCATNPRKCPDINGSCDDGPNPEPVLDAAEEGLISDITNTGDVVVNIQDGIDVS